MKPTIYLWGTAEKYQNYLRAVTAAGGQIRFGGETEGCDALLLPGGGDLEPWRYGQANTASRSLEPERDQVEMALLEAFTDAKKPVLGICRGLQVINVFFGGSLIQDLPGHSAAGGIDRLHTVTSAPSALGELYGPTCIVNSAHHQAADRLGSGLEAVQWSRDGVVEALCHTRLPVWAVQWHPERLSGRFSKAGAVDGSALFSRFIQACRP